MTTLYTPSGARADPPPSCASVSRPSLPSSPIDAPINADHPKDEAPLTSSATGSSSSEANRQETSDSPPQGSVLSALSISLYESMSFSRSPSFERTRYIVSTCTFIAIIYLRTLHCLFFGTGALSCAVLAKCLKHIIRQPRPYVARVDEEEEEEAVAVSANDPVTAPPPSLSFSAPGSASNYETSEARLKAAGIAAIRNTSLTSTDFENGTTCARTLSEAATFPLHVDKDEGAMLPSLRKGFQEIPRSPSPTLSLAPATSLQQKLVDTANAEQKASVCTSPSSSSSTTTATNTNGNTVTSTTKPKIKRLRLQNRHRRKMIMRMRIDYGMPSSHAQLVAFFVCYISLQLILTMEPDKGAFGQWFLILLLQLYAWSAVWSRVRLGRHTVAQVLVGAAVGAVYGIVWFTLWCWKIEDMIQHWQWMDRYGVIQVRKMWRQLEMEGARLDGRGMMFQPLHHRHHRNPGFPLGY